MNREGFLLSHHDCLVAGTGAELAGARDTSCRVAGERGELGHLADLGACGPLLDAAIAPIAECLLDNVAVGYSDVLISVVAGTFKLVQRRKVALYGACCSRSRALLDTPVIVLDLELDGARAHGDGAALLVIG